jgi:formylglycine-generating enzyme required for sulfatase activity
VTNPSNPSIAQSFKAGDKLAGCYNLKELLPPQGCCVVWLAHDEELNKDIVLHFVPDSVAADTRAMSELKQEAKRNRQLIHPRIVRVHDLVEDERWAAISMDHVQGETLASLQQKRPGKAFNPSDLATGVAELCQTIEDAHRIELFHRDLTPDNIVATANGIVVQKFGLSRVILDSLARSGQPIANSRDLTYISPQQLDGERASRADDIYSLGATVYDLLTGAPPFSQGDLIPQIRKTIPPLVSERRAAQNIAGEPVPKAWDDAIAACLSKNPEERPKSATEAGNRFSTAKAGASPSPAAPAVAAAAVAGAAVAVAASGDAPKGAAPATPPAPAPEKPAPAPEAAKPAPEPPKATPEPAKPAAEPEKPATPEPDAAKQQKRPWSPGPGKSPIIAEATVISNTPVPKKDAKTEPAADAGAKAAEKKGAPGGPTTPTGFPLRAFVEVEGDASKAKPKGSPFVITGLVVLAAIVLLGYLVYHNSANSAASADSSVASSGTGSQTSSAPPEAATSPIPVEAASPAPSAPVNLAASSTPAPSATPAEAAASAAPTAVAVEAATPAATPGIPEAAPAPVAAAPIPAGSLDNLTEAQAQQMLADNTKAVDQAKAALADAEKNSKAQAAAQAQAASTVQTLQAQIKQKADAAAAAKAAAAAATAAIAQQQDALNKARADADAAQKAAAAKAQAADQLAKTLADAQTAAQQKQAAAAQAVADADQAAKTVADRQKAADDAAKAAADAEKARQKQAQALAQAQSDLTQLQAGIAQAENARKARAAAEEAARIQKAKAEEAARLQKERAEQTARLTAQAAAAAKAAEDAQKALDAAKKAVADAEKAQAEAEREAAAARNGTLPMASPAPSPGASPAAAATPPSGASASPVPSGAGPTLSVQPPKTSLKVDQVLVNSLGMRFAPVGHIFFCIWPTRVQDFDAFARATGYSSTAWQDPGFKQAPDHPVVNVSWNDANQFCLWLTEKEHHDGILAAGEAYRLPTDLEWSNAVGLPPESGRTPESRDMDVADVYPWGTQWPPPAGAGNYTGEETDSDVAIKGYNDGFAWTSPVGSFSANKFGLYDMGGNVWEWVQDWWNPEQKEKVLRGASWNNGALKLSLLSACREKASADLRLDDYGFRVVLASEGGRRRHPAQ